MSMLEPARARPRRPGAKGLRLRMMRLEDAAAAAAIERASFSDGWPMTAFEREISLNSAAHYITLEGPAPEGSHTLEREVLGFAGLWLMLDEAHVVSVAVAQEHRGRGLGRLLVHGLVDVACRRQMSVATLECRESNVAARSLYRHYGFYEVGVRKRYYAGSHEDAIIMTTEELDSPAYRARYARLAAYLEERLPGVAFQVS